ncbi:kinesin-like protein klp-20 [Engraulis encrasicolus]|uniref:kinesin-like protein klp-20 n=1 Tax=Engraulis encrasicolus TaxID=184585 RepID=UPI002FD5C796
MFLFIFRCLDKMTDKDLEVCELQDRVKHLQRKNSLAQELLHDQKKFHKISMDAIKEKVEHLNKKIEEHKSDKKLPPNHDDLRDYKALAETQQRMLRERAEEHAEINTLMNHYVTRLQSAEEKLVITDKKLVAALSKAEALEKELIQTLKETSQKRSKCYNKIYKLRDKLSDTKEQHKRDIERRDDQIKELQRQVLVLTRKVEKLTETTEMMDKVNTELLREKRQFYRDLNEDFLV